MHMVFYGVTRTMTSHECRSFFIDKETTWHALRWYRRNRQSQGHRYMEKYTVIPYQITGNYLIRLIKGGEQ